MVILRSDLALCTERIANLGEQRQQNPRVISLVILNLGFLMTFSILLFDSCFKEHSQNQIYQL